MHRERALKIVLMIVGLFFTAGVYPLAISLWQANQSEYMEMMLSVYVTLGIFLLLAVREPSAHRSVIAFTAWSSFAHAAVMVVQAFHNARGRQELLIGSALLVVIGLALIVATPAKPAIERAPAAVA